MSVDNELENFQIKDGSKFTVNELKSRLLQMDVEFDVYINQKKYFVEIYNNKIKEKFFRDKIQEKLKKDFDEMNVKKRKRVRNRENVNVSPPKENEKISEEIINSGKKMKLSTSQNLLNESYNRITSEKTKNIKKNILLALNVSQRHSDSQNKSGKKEFSLEEINKISFSQKKDKNEENEEIKTVEKTRYYSISEFDARSYYNERTPHSITNFEKKLNSSMDEKDNNLITKIEDDIKTKEDENKKLNQIDEIQQNSDKKTKRLIVYSDNEKDFNFINNIKLNNSDEEKLNSLNTNDLQEENNNNKQTTKDIKDNNEICDPIKNEQINYILIPNSITINEKIYNSEDNKTIENYCNQSLLPKEEISNKLIVDNQSNYYHNIDENMINNDKNCQIQLNYVHSENQINNNLYKNHLFDSIKLSLIDTLNYSNVEYDFKNEQSITSIKEDTPIFKPIDNTDELYREINPLEQREKINEFKKNEFSLNLGKIPIKDSSNIMNKSTIINKSDTSFGLETNIINFVNNSISYAESKIDKNINVNAKPNQAKNSENINLFNKKQTSLAFNLQKPEHIKNNYFSGVIINSDFDPYKSRFITNIKRSDLVEKNISHYNSIRYEKHRNNNNKDKFSLNLNESQKIIGKSNLDRKPNENEERENNNIINFNLIHNYNHNEPSNEFLNNSKISSKRETSNKNSLIVIHELPTENYYKKTRNDFPISLRSSYEFNGRKTSNKTLIFLKITLLSTVFILAIHVFLKVFHSRNTSENLFKNIFDFKSYLADNSNFVNSLSISYLTSLMNSSELLSFLIINYWKIAIVTGIFLMIAKIYLNKQKKNNYLKMGEIIYQKIIEFLISCKKEERKNITEEYLIKRYSDEYKIDEKEFKCEIFPLLEKMTKNCRNIKVSKINSNNKSELTFWEWHS